MQAIWMVQIVAVCPGFTSSGIGEVANELPTDPNNMIIHNKIDVFFIFSPFFISGFHFREKELHTK
jgi:hypothetical protein